jgi:tetratricopeptide (TPR) repeat protein
MGLLAPLAIFAIGFWLWLVKPAAEACLGPTEPRVEQLNACTIAHVGHFVSGRMEESAFYLMRGSDILEQLGHREQADKARVSAAILANGASSVRAEGARIDSVRGRFELALATYTELVEENPSDALNFVNRGIVHRRMGHSDLALADFATAIKLDPANAGALNSRAWLLHLSGRNDEALVDVDRALEIMPTAVEAIDTRASILAGLGRLDEATSEYLHAMRIGGPPTVRFYQKHLKSNGITIVGEEGRMSAELQAALASCLKRGCRLMDKIHKRPEDRNAE